MKNIVKLSDYKNEHSVYNRLGRLIWQITWLFFCRWTPSPLFRWRNFICKLFGGKIASGCHIYPSAKIWAPWNLTMGANSCLGPRVDCYCVAKIIIGDNVTISQDAFLCTASHDISSQNMMLISKDITINGMAWVCARSFVGPGVTLGEGSVLGAMSSATKDIPKWCVYSGCPAIFIKDRRINDA
jgi:putative colanic acid biosynthesis acetyltransferase WcaF